MKQLRKQFDEDCENPFPHLDIEFGIVKSNGADLAGKNRFIEGWATTNDLDRVKDIVTEEALKASEKDLLEPGSTTVFFNHNTDMPIGNVVESRFKKVGKRAGIWVKVQISKATDVESIWTKIKEKVLNSFSIRLKPIKIEVVEKEGGLIDYFRIVSMKLSEVSVVGLPANQFASVEGFVEKSFEVIQKREKQMKRSDQDTAEANRKENISAIVKEVVGKDIDELKSAVATIAESIKGITASKAEADKAEADKAKAAADKAAADKAAADKAKAEAGKAGEKQIADIVKEALKEALAGMDAGGKKKSLVGKDANKDTDDDDEDGDVEFKSLHDQLDDPKIVKQVVGVMNDFAKYQKLSTEEKEQYKKAYFAIYTAANLTESAK